MERSRYIILTERALHITARPVEIDPGTESALPEMTLGGTNRRERAANHISRENTMNWSQIEGQWHQISGQAKSMWAKLTDDDLKNIAGKREQLIGKVQERYGILKEEAEKQVHEWIAKFSSSDDKRA